MSAEHSLLAILLADNTAHARVSDLVHPTDLSAYGQRVWEFVKGQGGDLVVLGERAEREGDRDFASWLTSELLGAPGTRGNVEHYARMVAEAGERRRIREAGQRIAICETFEDAREHFDAIRPQVAQRVKTVRDGVSQILDDMQARASGIRGLSWGIDEVNAKLGRLVGSRLYGIAGRAKMGKTTFSLAPQLAAVLDGRRVLNFSLEMTVGELTQRGLASVGRFDHSVFEAEDGVPDESWPMIHAAAKRLINDCWLIDDQPGLTPDQIIARAKRHHMDEPLDLIVVDHMGLVRLPHRKGANRTEELGELSYALKGLAKELNVPVLALLQLNRSLESRDNKRPEARDLRDSGSIEQDFDCIAGVYRDEVYDPNSADAGHAEIIAIANRHRRADTAFVRADMETMTYGPAQKPRECFPGVGSHRGGSAGGGFASRFGGGSKPRAVPVARGGFGDAA